jgi:plasmid stabilization system protein ParE
LLTLLEFPESGAAVPGRANTRWVASGSHRIVYRLYPRELRVMRFLHVKQDFGRHLR